MPAIDRRRGALPGQQVDLRESEVQKRSVSPDQEHPVSFSIRLTSGDQVHVRTSRLALEKVNQEIARLERAAGTARRFVGTMAVKDEDRWAAGAVARTPEASLFCLLVWAHDGRPP